MDNSINETAIRLGIFLGLLILFMTWETISPRRQVTQSKIPRWLTNFGMTFINSLAIYIMGPLTAIIVAEYAVSQGWGLFQTIEWHLAIEVLLAIILLDLAIYAQHVATHKIPLLWRLHKVHHSDRDFDTSTALRFHPIEIMLSMLYKALLVILIGPNVMAVLIFEILLNGCAMFNHSNLRLSPQIDRIVRSILVTPDMHRVHHSVRANETNSNYGFSLSLWDKIFKTYKAQPEAGHEKMTIGLREHQTEAPNRLFWALLLPFRPKVE